MELTDDNLRTLSEYLRQTLSPDIAVRRPAEKFLESVEVNQNYPLLLLHLIDKPGIDMIIRIAGSVAFKNYIKRNWPLDEDAGDKIHIQDRDAIKKSIVNLMLHSPEAIQKQLSDAVSIIGRHDFPAKWPDLISQMVEKFASGDFHVINGILHTAHSLFKRYRFEFKNQELWTEIKFVLDNFAAPFTELFKATMGLTVVHATSPEALRVIYSSLGLISKVFYSLNFQDLPEYFEDNMETWMSNFHTLLTTDVKCLHTGEDEEASLLEVLKSQVVDNVSLYAQKYDEEFQPFLPQFVTVIWNLLVTTGQQPKYDLLVSNSLQFLATVADRSHYRHLFEDPTVLGGICEKVIIPNMEFRTVDEELFEDNPEEYIRRDIEGSDVDTRRRAACDLVKVLSKYFEAKMMEIFSQYIQVMLNKYAENPTVNWRSKDAALYLVTSLASKGQTQKHGITQTSQLVNLVDFATQHIFTELAKPDLNILPVLKADALKYVMIFRSVLPREMMLSSLPQLVRHLGSSIHVVHTYAACAIEKILVMRTPDNLPVVKSEDLAPLAEPLLRGLLHTLTFPSSHENEYVMKAVMRSLHTLQARVLPLLNEVLAALTDILGAVAKNPSKPHFNHFIFESFSIAIQICCSSQPEMVAQLEGGLFPIFQAILQQDILEFIPYVFQIISLLLEQRSGSVPESYMILFPCLLAPPLWDRPGNIRPLVRLLQAYLAIGSVQIVQAQKVSGILGVFQKLIASKSNDHEGFYLMQSMLEYFPPEVLQPFVKQVFVLLFQRMSSSKTTKFIKGFLVFQCLYAIKYGPSNLIAIVDSIQPSMFGMVLERLFIQEIQKVSGTVERKIAAIGMIKLLCEAVELVDGPYAHLWAPLLQALISLFELPEDISSTADDHFIEVDDSPAYQVAYSQLAFANKKEHDPVQAVPDARMHLAQCLSKLSTSYPGRLPPLLQTGLTENHREYLKRYLDAASLQLS